MEIIVTTENGICTREEQCPEGWTEVVIYRPNRSTTPWDYYGMSELRRFSGVLKDAGIRSKKLRTYEEAVSPHGSGPGGRVRFGDSMMPGVYRLAVNKEDEAAAVAAIAEHRAAMDQWVFHDGPKPKFY